MKTIVALLALLAFASSGFARSWPEWLPAHVTEIRFRDGVPGAQLRAVTDRSEIEKILQAFRRAQEVKPKEPVARSSWQVCVDMIGERPEAGRWLLNLETGNCTFLDPLVQPVYRLAEDDRQALRAYFRAKQKME